MMIAQKIIDYGFGCAGKRRLFTSEAVQKHSSGRFHPPGIETCHYNGNDERSVKVRNMQLCDTNLIYSRVIALQIS